MKETANLFGKSLDQDDFPTTKKLLSPDCRYLIGEETLIGPEAICKSYEDNMIEGRQTLLGIKLRVLAVSVLVKE